MRGKKRLTTKRMGNGGSFHFDDYVAFKSLQSTEKKNAHPTIRPIYGLSKKFLTLTLYLVMICSFIHKTQERRKKNV